MAFWAACRLQPHRTALALHCLALSRFNTYLPRLREFRVSRRRRIETWLPLFPGYCFVWIELQWHAARWCPGTLGLIMDGLAPARVPDSVISEIRARERNGAIELPRHRPRRGDHVRILRGPFQGSCAIFADMKAHERVEVLLMLLGGQRRVTLAQKDVEAITS
jgi:transcriptional antiterminator RfaH